MGEEETSHIHLYTASCVARSAGMAIDDDGTTILKSAIGGGKIRRPPHGCTVLSHLVCLSCITQPPWFGGVMPRALLSPLSGDVDVH
jgi:hypothetical protein